ncbi:Ohr family peroxiredoxin [Vagococcus vulneris]|uniref:Organic hydroperoxide resistance protein n=1 Tax=Vagococcus vulneris TaxID=1977869 RepID=A0A430A263_9ENTE|nr:Ohr family peroxiredoxin [Vagococcus vulneris]RSU00544.1 organic hydroperoxide resistance protein [Vagococcus vulneris]
MSKKISVSTVINTGGREGESKSVGGFLDLKISSQKKAGYTNPEELFAAGISACFNGALEFPLKRDGLESRNREIRAEVSLLGDLPDFHSLHLAVNLIGKIEGLSKEETMKYLKETEGICPYTKAIEGNVKINLVAE